MQLDKQLLLKELTKISENAILSAQKFKALSDNALNFRSQPDSWSILECIEHLNRYGEFYLPEIEKQMLAYPQSTGSIYFRSGIIGNYFTKLMQSSNGKIKKMKTVANMNPIHSTLSATTLDRFLKQMELLNRLLVMAQNTDLTRVKTAITLTPFIKLRLGDTFRFLIYHIERHIIQAEKLMPIEEKKGNFRSEFIN